MESNSGKTSVYVVIIVRIVVYIYLLSHCRGRYIYAASVNIRVEEQGGSLPVLWSVVSVRHV